MIESFSSRNAWKRQNFAQTSSDQVPKPWRCKSSKLQNMMFWIHYFHLSPKGWMTSRSDKNEDCPGPLLPSAFVMNKMMCWIMLFLVFLVFLYQETFWYLLTFIVARHTPGLCKWKVVTGAHFVFKLIKHMVKHAPIEVIEKD